MKKYDVTMIYGTYVEAENAERAKEIAIEKISLLSPNDIRALLEVEEQEK